jgi:hypothetical protein
LKRKRRSEGQEGGAGNRGCGLSLQGGTHLSPLLYHRFGSSRNDSYKTWKRYPKSEHEAAKGMALAGLHCSYFLGS